MSLRLGVEKTLSARQGKGESVDVGNKDSEHAEIE